MIPKIIHQTWKHDKDLPKIESFEAMPPDFQESYKSWKVNHPTWQYIYWTDEMNRKLIEEDFPWFLSYYDNFQYNIQRADAIRYFILYKYGGIYVDLDEKSTNPIDPIIDEMNRNGDQLGFVKSTLGNYFSFSNWFMISSKENPFWKSVWIEIMKPYKHFTKHFTVINSAGPGMLSRVIKREKVEYKLLDKGFHPCGACDTKPCEKEGYYIAHLSGQSWNNNLTFFMMKMWCNKVMILFFFIFVVLLGCCCAYYKPLSTTSSERVCV